MVKTVYLGDLGIFELHKGISTRLPSLLRPSEPEISDGSELAEELPHLFLVEAVGNVADVNHAAAARGGEGGNLRNFAVLGRVGHREVRFLLIRSPNLQLLLRDLFYFVRTLGDLLKLCVCLNGWKFCRCLCLICI